MSTGKFSWVSPARTGGRLLEYLGRCALAAGHPARATASPQQAHQIFQQIGAAETASVAAELAAAVK